MNYTPVESDVPSTTIQGNINTTGSASVNDQSNDGPKIDPRKWLLAKRLSESSHPIALSFYIFLRLAPPFFYLFGTLFIAVFASEGKFILHFIILILLVSADFWNLKNIAGRLLVGLRWWNETHVKEAGKTDFENVWIFENADPKRYINPVDANVFWTLLYVQPLVWIMFAGLAVLKFEFLYLIFITIALILSLSNALAFTKCDKFGKANNLAADLIKSNSASMFSRFNPFG